jgi:cephalosporin hydroxylase
VGNNPKTAVSEWLGGRSDFVQDGEFEQMLQVTVAPSGFLRKVG